MSQYTNSPHSRKTSGHGIQAPRPALYSLNVIIVGCGLGGLAAAYCLGRSGHRVTVLEAATKLAEVGAGIQLGPNVTRLLVRWGLGEKLKELAVVPSALTFHRYDTGELLGLTEWGPSMEQKHGAPYYHIHRADLLNLLHELAAPYMTLHLSSRVSSITAPTFPNQHTSVTLTTGQTYTCDLLIGADGLKSIVRPTVLGRADRPLDTGDSAYRAMISTDDMMMDEELRDLVERAEMAGWLGPGRHVMTYCVRAKKEFNIVLLHPTPKEGQDSESESYTAEGCVERMRKEFEGWDPRIQKLLKLVKSTLIWHLKDRAPLDTWVHPSGRMTLLGDACHPMLPYRAQGSAMALEDVAVLSNLLSRLTHPSQLPMLLNAYQNLRLPRSTETQRASRLNQWIFHMSDGPEQKERDRSMREAMIGEDGSNGQGHAGNANVWADKEKSRIQFDYDADLVVEKWWDDAGMREVSMSTSGLSQGLRAKL